MEMVHSGSGLEDIGAGLPCHQPLRGFGGGGVLPVVQYQGARVPALGLRQEATCRWSATIAGEMKAYDELQHHEQKLRIELMTTINLQHDRHEYAMHRGGILNRS